MQFVMILKLFIVYPYINCWMDSYITELPAILKFYAGVANATRTSIGVEGGSGREPQSSRQRVRPNWKQPSDVHWCHFQLHKSHKTAKLMAQLISQLCGKPAVCLSWMVEPFKDHPNTHGHLTNHRNKPQQKQPGHQYLPESLFNVYSYCSVVKSVSCCCVHGRWLFSNPVMKICFRIMGISIVFKHQVMAAFE